MPWPAKAPWMGACRRRRLPALKVVTIWAHYSWDGRPIQPESQHTCLCRKPPPLEPTNSWKQHVPHMWVDRWKHLKTVVMDPLFTGTACTCWHLPKTTFFPNHKDLGIPIRSKHPSKTVVTVTYAAARNTHFQDESPYPNPDLWMVMLHQWPLAGKRWQVW